MLKLGVITMDNNQEDEREFNERFLDNPSPKNFDLNGTFQFDKFHLILGGIYPLKQIKYKSFYILARIVVGVVSWIQLLGMMAFSLIHMFNLVELTETLAFNVTQIAFMCKLLNLFLRRNALLYLETFLRKPTLTWVTPEEEAIIKDTIRGTRRLGAIFRSLCVIIVFLYALFPFIDNNTGEGKKLPLPMWFPFEAQKHFTLVWTYEIFSIAIGAWINTNLDSLSVTVITLTICQFQLLKRRLQNVVKTTEGVVDNRLVQKELKECVIHYNDITSLVALVETTFSNGIFLQFLCSVLVICMTGFQMIVIDYKSVRFFLLLSYFFGQTCQLVMYCWYGHTLMESSGSINDACYSSEWYNCNNETQKYFLIIMERSKRPVMMRAGKFFFLNLDTLMAILKSSYSYFTVLRQFYSSK